MATPARAFPKASPAQRARYAKRRAGRMRRANNDLTETEWMWIVEAWGRVCAYCGAARALQKDCVLPLSRGGRYTRDNVVPACRSCNASKRNDEVTAWMRRKGLDERAFLLKLAHASAGGEPGTGGDQPGTAGAEMGAGGGEKGP